MTLRALAQNHRTEAKIEIGTEFVVVERKKGPIWTEIILESKTVQNGASNR